MNQPSQIEFHKKCDAICLQLISFARNVNNCTKFIFLFTLSLIGMVVWELNGGDQNFEPKLNKPYN